MKRIALWLARHQLKSKTPARRLRALKKLRTALNDAVVALDDKITIALLDHTLTDPEMEIRREVAAILGDLRDVRALPPMIRALSDPAESVQEAAIQGLKKLDDKKAITSLLAKLFHGSPTIQWRAGVALKSLGWRPQNDAETIKFCVALGEFKQLSNFGAEAVKPLVELLRYGTSDKKISAVKVLGEIGDPAALKPMQNLLRDADPFVRCAAVYALERADFREAAPALVSALKDTARNVRLAAALVLGTMGNDQTVLPLIQLLNDQDWEIRRAALEALGKLGDTRAFPSVAKHLDDADKEVREVAADALGNVGNETIVEKLVFTMVDAHSGVRQAAARALTRIYPQWEKSDRVKRLLPEIQAAMKHRDVNVQSAASNLFQRVAGPTMSSATIASATPLRSPPAVTILREMLHATAAELRLAAAQSIGRMKLKECEADLRERLQDSEKTVQQAAQDALAKLAAPESASGQSKVTFLSPVAGNQVPETPQAAEAEVLICSAIGEVLHEWKCRELALWLKTHEFILPQAEQLVRLMTLGDAKQVMIQTVTTRITIFITASGTVMIRTKNERANNADAPGSSSAGVGISESVKEVVADWLRRTPSGSGVLMRGIRFPDQTVLCDVDSRSLSATAIEEAYRLVVDAFNWLRTNQIKTTHLVWGGDRAELHCVLRSDGCVLGVMASAKAGEPDLSELNRQLGEFKILPAA